MRARQTQEKAGVFSSCLFLLPSLLLLLLLSLLLVTSLLLCKINVLSHTRRPLSDSVKTTAS